MNHVTKFAEISDTVKHALKVATQAHKGQFRFDGKPYITHPIAVANIVVEDGNLGAFTIDAIVAALLHDVVEDTPITLDDLEKEYFSPYQIHLVDCLSRRKGESYTQFILRVATDEVATKVKLADLKHNLSDLDKSQRRDKYELATELLKLLVEKRKHNEYERS